jgi:hypothetical protein
MIFLTAAAHTTHHPPPTTQYFLPRYVNFDVFLTSLGLIDPPRPPEKRPFGHQDPRYPLLEN